MNRPTSVSNFSAALLIVAGSLLAGCGGPSTSSPGGDEGKPAPLILVGLDAATWDVIDPMIENGELPHIAALRAGGTAGDLLVLPPLSSPVVWTTYMTGHFARRHGVLDHTYPFTAGAKRRVTSTVRREPALWNIASHFGRRTGVFGYYASHPVEKIDGVMVSDRADQVDSGGVYPPELEPEVRKIQRRLEDPEQLRQLRAVYFPEPYDPQQAAAPDSPFAELLQPVRRLDRGLRHEAFVGETALEILEGSFEPGGERFDIFVVYLRMPDITCHTTWLYFDDSTFDAKSPESAAGLLGGCIPAAYRQADAFLGRLLEALDAGYGDGAYNFIALSDHGCGPATGRHAIKREKLQHMSGNHYANGVVLGRGPDLAKGRLPRMAHIDVMPSLMALAGLPLSDELPGEIHRPLLRPGLLEERPPRRAPSYRLQWQTADAGEVSNEAEGEELAALEALGYVDGGTPLADSSGGDDDFDFWQIEDRLMHSAVVGEAMFHLTRGDTDTFQRLSEEVEQNRPDFAPHFARVTRNWLHLWQESFEGPIVDEAIRLELEAEVKRRRAATVKP